jgi:hypothetical protein
MKISCMCTFKINIVLRELTGAKIRLKEYTLFNFTIRKIFGL